MLHSLKLKNWRAYGKQSFSFTSLNIFVGANNTGKSSALSAINFLAQSFLQGDVNSGPLSINGSFEQLGTFLDVVHGNRANTPIGFEIVYGRDKKDRRHKISFEMKYRWQSKIIEITSFAYSYRNEQVYSYKDFKKGFVVKVRGRKLSGLTNDVQRKPRFLTIFPVDTIVSRYGFAVEGEVAPIKRASRMILRDVDRLMRQGRTVLREAFQRFDSIGPFRDQPQRTYLFTGETPSRVGRTGSNSISLLVNDSSKRELGRAGIVERISRFLSETGIAKRLELRALTRRHFEMCVVDWNNQRFNICDVGFGCSQVLPVLVGGLNMLSVRVGSPTRTATFIVQEPEIHLHSNAQATLGSFFVSLAAAHNQIFIETHSDNLILRIATHAVSDDVSHGDIAFFLCENRSGRKRVRRLALDDKAVFQPAWPGGFFPQREQEVLALSRARRIKGS